MTSALKNFDYLTKYGPALVNHGYEIAPLPAASYQFLQLPEQAVPWAPEALPAEGFFGNATAIGFYGRSTPLVHIDSESPDLLNHMLKYIEHVTGKSLRQMAWINENLSRLGYGSPVALPFRSEKPLTRAGSLRFVDPAAQLSHFSDPDHFYRLSVHHVEVFGGDTCWLGYGMNNDTNLPFRWERKQAPHTVPWESLPLLSQEVADAICCEFDRLCIKLGFAEGRLFRCQPRRSVTPIDTLALPVAADDFEAVIEWSPAFDDYLTWLGVGLELWRRNDPEHDYLEVWHEWSVRTDSLGHGQLLEKWNRFTWDTPQILTFFQAAIARREGSV